MSYPSKTEFDNLRNSLPLTYQTRGNYAFRTDLASNINTALRNVNTALAFYAKKNDIPIVPANVATKTDLVNFQPKGEYALASDLGKYQPAGRYVSPSELENYQPKGDYASAKELVSYAKSSDLANYQSKGEYALATDLASYAKESSLAFYQPKGDYQPKGSYALQTDLAAYAKESSLAGYAKTTDLAAYAKESSLAGYAKTTDLAAYAKESSLAGYALKPSAGSYALQSSLANYALSKELALLQPKGNYQTAGSYALQTDLGSYAKTTDLGSYAKTTDLGSYAKTTDLASYQPKGDYQPKGSYALQTDLGSYAKTTDLAAYAKESSLAGYALKPTVGSYALQTDLGSYAKTTDLGSYAKTTDLGSYAKTTDLGSYALKPSSGNYALQTDLVGYAKTVGATTFGGQATFDGNAIVKTTDKSPFQVTGTGGLRVTGGGLTVTGDSTFGGDLNVANIVNIAKLFATSGSITNLIATNISAASIAGYQTAGNYVLQDALKTSLAGYALQTSLDKYALKTELTSLQGSTGALQTNLAGYQTAGNYVLQEALKTELAGYAKTAGATTFGGQATFKGNATVTTADSKPFDVLGTGGLRVTGGGLTVTGNSTFGGNLNATNIIATNISAASIAGYQTAGNYVLQDALKTSLAAYQTAGSYALQTDLGSYALKTDLADDLNGFAIGLTEWFAGYQTAGNYVLQDALKTELASYAKTTGATTFKGQATFDGNAIVKTEGTIPFQVTGAGGLRVSGGNLNATNIIATNISAASIAGYQTAGNYVLQDALKTSLAAYQTAGSYALLADLAGYALKTSLDKYALQTSLAGYQTAGSYALQTELAGYAKTAGATTFGGQATFNKNAIVKTEGTIPFDVLGTGGLRVSGGNLNATNIIATNISAASIAGYQTAGNYVLQTALDKYALQTSLAGYQTAGNYALQTELAGYAKTAGATTFGGQATFNKNAIVKTEGTIPFDVLGTGGLRVTGGGLTVTGDSTFSGNSTFSGSLAANHMFLQSGTDPSLRLGPNVKDTGTARLNIQEKIGNYMKFFQGTTEKGSITHTTANGVEVNVGKVSAAEASITNLTVGNFIMTGAPTFSSQATFSGNATVTTADSKPFEVTGAGGLRVTGGGLTVTGDQTIGGSLKVAGGIRGDVYITGGNLNVYGNQSIGGTQTANEIVTNNWKINSDGSTLIFKNSTNPITQSWLQGRGENEVIQFKLTNSGILLPAGVDTTGVYRGVNSITTGNLQVNGKVSAAEASITNLTVGNFIMTGAPTFSSQATFSGNATVTTADTKPFQVTGAGGLRVTGGGLTVTGDSTFGGKLNVTSIVNIGNLFATSGSISTFSSGNAEITNLTIGNMNMTGAPTFSSQATFSGNATVTTADTKPFEVTGAGGLRVTGGGLTVTGNSTFSGNLNVAKIINIGELSATSGSISTFSSGNASITNLTIGNFIMTGAPTFSSQATFKGNATVTTADTKPFEVTGPGGLKVTGRILAPEGIYLNDTSSEFFSYGNNTLGNYGLKWANETGNTNGATAFVSSYGGIKMFTKGKERLYIDSDGHVTFTGGATIKGASTFSSQATFKGNATVTTADSKPFEVTGAGGLRVTGGGLTVTGGLAANHMFLESGTDPSLRLGPNVKDTGTARLNIQEKIGNYMKFFQGTTEKGSITHTTANGVEVNVGKINSDNLYVGGDSNVGNQHVRGIFPAPATSSQGLHFQWNRSGNDGESWIINNQGGGGANAGIRFGKSDANNNVTEFGRFYNDGLFNVGNINAAKLFANNGLELGQAGTVDQIKTPDTNTYINNHGIQLGGNNNGLELNSAQISAGIHVPNSLNIVGMGTTDKNRKVDMWAEGGLTVNGPANFYLDNKTGGIDLTNGTKGSGGIYMANSDTEYTTDSKAGDMVIRNNKGTMRFLQGSGGSAMTINSNNKVNFPGKSLNFGGATFVVGGAEGKDDWVRMQESDGKAYNYGLAAKKFWTDGNLDVGGTASIATANVTSQLNLPSSWFIQVREGNGTSYLVFGKDDTKLLVIDGNGWVGSRKGFGTTNFGGIS